MADTARSAADSWSDPSAALAAALHARSGVSGRAAAAVAVSVLAAFCAAWRCRALKRTRYHLSWLQALNWLQAPT